MQMCVEKTEYMHMTERAALLQVIFLLREVEDDTRLFRILPTTFLYACGLNYCALMQKSRAYAATVEQEGADANLH